MSESELTLILVKALKDLGDEIRLLRTDIAAAKDLLKDRNPAPDRMMDNLEAERYLGVTGRTLRRWRADDLIDAVKFRGRVFYDRPYVRQVKAERDLGVHATLIGIRRK